MVNVNLCLVMILFYYFAKNICINDTADALPTNSSPKNVRKVQKHIGCLDYTTQPKEIYDSHSQASEKGAMVLIWHTGPLFRCLSHCVSEWVYVLICLYFVLGDTLQCSHHQTVCSGQCICIFIYINIFVTNKVARREARHVWASTIHANRVMLSLHLNTLYIEYALASSGTPKNYTLVVVVVDGIFGLFLPVWWSLS